MQRNDRLVKINEMSGLLNLRVTHMKTPVPILESLWFKDAKEASRAIRDMQGVEECLILQTCNRVEILLFVSDKDPVSFEREIAEYWWKKTLVDPELFYPYLEVSLSSDVFRHLMMLTSGLASMVIGEDQILAQVQEAFLDAKRYGTVGPVLEKVFAKAVRIGKKVRVKTGINKGSVSLGSIAVNLLEDIAGNIQNKKVMIIGAGRIGALAGKALAARKVSLIYVANRTYERAVAIAEMLKAQAVKFDRLVEFLSIADIVIVATSASHNVLTLKKVVESHKNRASGSKLLIVDLSQPRNVENGVADLPYVELHNIDNLRQVAAANLEMRKKEAEKAEALIEKEIEHLLAMHKKIDAEPIIQAVSSRADEIRRRELEKAYRLMKANPNAKQCSHCRTVMEDLSRKLLDRIMLDPLLSLRNAEIDEDTEKISLIQEIFRVNSCDIID